MTVVITWLFLFPAFQIAGFLSHEALELAKTARDLASGEGVESWKEQPWVNELLRLWEALSFQSAAWEIDLKEAVIQGTQLGSAFLVTRVKEIAQDVFTFTVNFIIALITFFFFLRDGRTFCERIRSLLPMGRQEQAHLFENIVNSVHAVIHGSLVTAVVQGLLAGPAYWFLGVPFAALLGVATAFTALFPIGGSSLIWLPAALYLFLQGSLVQAVALLVWGAGIVGTVDNVLKPILIGNRLKLPVLFLFFGILGGLRLFGVLGLVLGPVLFALLAALLDLYLRDYARG
jgi:predicted PurR-regulated permease PerM